MLSIVRRRMPKLRFTVLADVVLCIAISVVWPYAGYALALPVFSAMYLGVYIAVIAGAYLFFEFNALIAAMLILSCLCGLFLRFWSNEYIQRLQLRDESANKIYKLENMQSDFTSAMAQVERQTGLAERTRIARDIHDNAGHEIVAAYISFQAIRKLLGKYAAALGPERSAAQASSIVEILEMYDDALKRLNNGTSQIRETAHNLQSATLIGAESMSEVCRQFPLCPVNFRIYGDTTRLPMYVWNVLNSCLNECLTNVARHSRAKNVKVTLDAAQHIARLCVENDGIVKETGKSPKHPSASSGKMGVGLRNLRQRTATVGGSISVDTGNVFRVICVIPILEERLD